MQCIILIIIFNYKSITLWFYISIISKSIFTIFFY